MRWDYNDDFRDKFEKGVHRDILIVPHATDVTPVSGGPPKVTSKIPKLDKNDDPVYKDGHMVYEPVAFIITNDDIVKEKFEYTHSINSGNNLTFSASESAMVKFTIRNKKTYNENTERWELDVPNLQSYQFYDENNKQMIVGEVQTHWIIKVYTYIEGDSDSLLCLGMFVVEEDKVTGSGYEREITAYDLMYTFREMDIYNWYLHLFKGINKYDSDFAAYMTDEEREAAGLKLNEKTDENGKPVNQTDVELGENASGVDEDTYKKGQIRDPRKVWTIREALDDLMKNLIRKYPPDKTVTNKQKKEYYTTDDNPYEGAGIPVVLDPDLTDYPKKYNIPDKPGTGKYECYGYLPILEMPFYENPKIIKAEALSFGKLLEDIGVLGGCYPFIRSDYFVPGDYVKPVEGQPDTYYNCYEKCVLSFKPLPKKDAPIVSDNVFDNSDIVKGFKHDLYEVSTVKSLDIYNYYNSKEPSIAYNMLTEEETVKYNQHSSEVKRLNIENNMFISYLTTSVDDIKSKKDEENKEAKALIDDVYKPLIKLFKEGNSSYSYPEEIKAPYNVKPYLDTGDPILKHAYGNISQRIYTPYQLTTYGDPVRDVGDRISINFIDKVTGEQSRFNTYILERKLSGIQKMMDQYTAKGDMDNPVFGDYKSGSKYSGGSYSMQSFGYNSSGSGGGGESSSGSKTTIAGITLQDYCEIVRNHGIRFLDEPTACAANFINSKTTGEMIYTRGIYTIYPSDMEHQEQTIITEGDTTNPIRIYDYDNNEYVDITVNENDWAVFRPNRQDPYGFVYTSEHKWISLMDSNMIGMYTSDITDASQYTRGSTNGTVEYMGTSRECVYGDTINDWSDIYEDPEGHTWDSIFWTYPGYWECGYVGNFEQSCYCKTINITTIIEPHVEIKWTDPLNITTYEPVPCDWEGTVVVRKEGSAPLHRWDGTLIVDATIRDQHKVIPLYDQTVESNKEYYYGIFPYYTYFDDADHPLRRYRFTKTIRVKTDLVVFAPKIISIEMDDGSAPDPIWDGSEVAILWSGDDNRMTVQVLNDHVVFKLYTRNNVIYSFNAYTGTTVDSTDNIYVGFLAEEEKQYAKPSMLYYDGTYSYNQETPTISEMQDIYTWLHPTAAPNPPEEYTTECEAIQSSNVYGRNFTDYDLWMRYDSIIQFKTDYLAGSNMSYFNGNNRINNSDPDEQLYFSNGIARLDFNSSVGSLTVSDFEGSPIGFYFDAHNGSSAVDYRYGNWVNELHFSSVDSLWHNNSYAIGENGSIVYTTSFNSISDCVNYVYNNFRHVDFYVDDALWAKAQ